MFLGHNNPNREEEDTNSFVVNSTLGIIKECISEDNNVEAPLGIGK